jgi:hypothetical protein
MTYKIIYKQLRKQLEFAGFTFDGYFFGSFCDGVRFDSKYHAQKIKKMLETYPGVTDVHVLKCETDGTENEKSIKFVDNYNKYSILMR